MGRGKSVVGSQIVPFPASASQHLANAVAIPAAPTAPVELARMTIPGGNVAKIVMFTVELTAAVDPDTVTIHLFRGGVEIDATDVYEQDVGVGENVTLHVHFHEDDPGAGSVIYSVRADSTGGTATASERRGTATHG